MGFVILGQKKYEIPDIEVYTWLDHDMTFVARPRTRPTTALTLHWIGAEREGEKGAQQLHRTLVQRGLSVEFGIMNEGSIWQYVDPVEKRCSHASRVNNFSIGCEISSKGWAKPPVSWPLKRDIYIDTIHGWKSTWFDFFPEQYRAVEGLVKVLWLNGLVKRKVFAEPFSRIVTRDLEAGGVHGHLHAATWSKKHPKCDPGTRILRRLEDLV